MLSFKRTKFRMTDYNGRNNYGFAIRRRESQGIKMLSFSFNVGAFIIANNGLGFFLGEDYAQIIWAERRTK
jgi:hypothetical protein